MRLRKINPVINGRKIKPGAVKWIHLIIIIAAMAGFFMPWVKLSLSDTQAVAGRELVAGIGKLIGQSQEYTNKNGLGIFSGLNQLSPLRLLYAIPVLSLICVIFLFTKLSVVRKTASWLLASILLISPVYVQVLLKKAIPNIIEITIFGLMPGAFLCCAAGIALVMLLLADREEKHLSTDIYEEKEHRLLTSYSLLSMLSLISPWLPFIRLFAPSGLKSTQVYSMTLDEFIRISPGVKVLSLFSRFGPETGLGASAIFYAIPVLSILILVGLCLNKRLIRRAAALFNAVLLITASYGIVSVLSDNIANVQEISRVSMHIGAVLMFAAGVCYLGIFLTDRPIKLTDAVQKSAINHRFGYIILSILACILFLLPWSGLSEPIANSLGLTADPVPAGMSWPVNAIAVMKLLHNPVFYLLYLIPILSLITITSVLLNARGIRKISSGITAAILVTGPAFAYTRLEAMYQSLGTVKLRFTSILAVISGICLLVTLLTDKGDALSLKRVWRKINKAFEIILTALFAIVQLYPLVWLFLASFKNNNEIFSGKILALPTSWRYQNYVQVLFGARANETVSQAIRRVMTRQKDMTLFKFIIGGGSEGNILRYFMNSAFVVAVTVAVVLLFGAMASYAISRIRWKHSSLFFTFFILGMMIPVHVALSPLYVTFAEMGLIDSLWSLIIPYIGFGLPISIIVICGFMETIPYEIEESAKIDGANLFTVFFKIMVPMVMPALSTVMIFVFLQSWNELMFATSFITSGMKRTITVGINSIAISQYNTEYALIFAGLVIASLPTIIIYLAGSQQVQKSLIVGAVKG